MAITEGFCADLYCDCYGCQSGEIYPPAQAEFVGRNMTDISQQAREFGCELVKTARNAMRQDTRFRGITHEHYYHRTPDKNSL